MFNIADIFGHFANAMYSIGTNFKNIFYLRIFILIGALAEIYYAATISERPLWTSIFWLSLISLINAYHIILLLIERRGLDFNEHERKLKSLVFDAMSRVHFKKLMKIADWKDINENEFLIEKDKMIDELLLISEGKVKIDVDGRIVNTLSEGGFIGEISFLTRSKPTASVITSEDSKIVSWDKTKLEKLLEKDPTLKNELYNVFSSDLIKKLIEQNKIKT